MDAFKIKISGNWAHFRKAETNNNPLSHEFMTKTALVGLIGAVLGIERGEMKEQFPILCEGLIYGLQVNNIVKKQSWGFTFRNVNHAWDKAPKQMEFIKDPSYTIIIGLKDESYKSLFNQLSDYLESSKACYTPILGLHNCPASIEYLEKGDLKQDNGDFDTLGFVTSHYQPKMNEEADLRIGFDKIPTYQDNDFWNLPEKFVDVVFPSNGAKLNVNGIYYEFNKTSKWCMI